MSEQHITGVDEDRCRRGLDGGYCTGGLRNRVEHGYGRGKKRADVEGEMGYGMST